MAERALAPSGRVQKLSTIRNTPELLKVAPELRGVPPGSLFDTNLVKAFERVESTVDAAEQSVPRSTKVPKEKIMSDFDALKQDYAARNLGESVRAVEKVEAAWKDQPAMIPWDDFVKLKRAFLKEGRSASNAAMRRAYGVLMDASTRVSETLAKANKDYSTVRKALDAAGIDPVTGRRIGQVGKAPQKPVGYAERPAPKPFNLPL
jgi:hypothetical protein